MQEWDCYESQDSSYFGGREGALNWMGHIEGLVIWLEKFCFLTQMVASVATLELFISSLFI